MNTARRTIYKIAQVPFGRMLNEFADNFLAIDGPFCPLCYRVRWRPACG